MKNLKISSILIKTISISFIIVISVTSSLACGPWNPIIPTPEFFYVSNYSEVKEKVDIDKQENLLLWQKLTSPEIPLEDIEKAVYKDSWDIVHEQTGYPKKPTKNLFYTYLKNSNDRELTDFLLAAKNLEEKREIQNSPWYYPSSRNDWEENEWLYQFIDNCKSYKGSKMKDRYGLQIVRAYFTARDYETCINFYEDYFSAYPDTNLFKKMSMSYIAGCWERLGNYDKAFEIYAKAGDFNAIASQKGVEYMADLNPDNVLLMEYIEKCAKDSIKFCNLEPVALKVLKQRKTKYPADWEFILAYLYGEHKGDYKTASKHIRNALNSRFSNEGIKDYARAYRAKIDAANYNTANLLSDLRWFERKINLLTPESSSWNCRLQNIVYVDWIPNLWRGEDYTTAIFLCGYADYLLLSEQKLDSYHYSPNESWESKENLTLDEMRTNDKLWNTEDYSNFTFQLMGSLRSDQLINVKNNLSSNLPLWKFLSKYIRRDNPYWNELIGTLALREENYDKAMTYLARVPIEYQKTMNIYKDRSLNRDPFFAYSNRWEVFESGDYHWENERRTQRVILSTMDNAKYNFAKQMAEYKRQMQYAKTSDERGLARIRYAVGRRNSFEECWALTQYWRGWVDRFTPNLTYWDCRDENYKYDFVYDYEDLVGHNSTWDIYVEEFDKGYNMLSDEAKAEVEYMLGNLKTVIKQFPDTKIAGFVKTSCDRWSNWL